MPHKISLIAVGKVKNTALSSLISDFEKKLGRYTQFSVIQTKDIKRSQTVNKAKADEAKLILSNIPKGAYVVALDEKGKLRTTQQLVDWYTELEHRCVGHLLFVVGGPDGLDPSVYERADERMGLSPMTFTHELARFIFTEQIYRVLSFRAGHPYHRV